VTLVTTEIWPGPPVFIVMAADQRISLAGNALSKRVKVMPLPSGRLGGISYFGLAKVQLSTRQPWMDEWLTDFLNKNTTFGRLEELAHALATTLNAIPRLDRTQPSGFQLAGIRADGAPEFWYIRNLDDLGNPTLGEWQAREDFQRRDAVGLRPGDGCIYRNGDFRAHVAAWKALDQSFGQLLTLPEFPLAPSPESHLRWVRFKMNVIADFYDQFATKSIIGKPVDALAITPTGVIKWRRWPRLASLGRPPAR
jgi:hypothetical protein